MQYIPVEYRRYVNPKDELYSLWKNNHPDKVFYEAIKSNHLKGVIYLCINDECNINHLNYSIEIGNMNVFRYLLDYCELDTSSVNVAIKYDRIDVLKFIISECDITIDIDQVVKIMKKNLDDIAIEIIEKFNYMQYPYMIKFIILLDKIEVYKHFKHPGVDPHPVQMLVACERGSIKIIDYIASLGLALSPKYFDAVIKSGKIECIKYFIEHKADHPRATHTAIANGNLDVLKLLIKNGYPCEDVSEITTIAIAKYLVPINCILDSCVTAAIENDNLQLLKYLVSLGYKLENKYVPSVAKHKDIKIVEYIYSLGMIIPDDNNLRDIRSGKMFTFLWEKGLRNFDTRSISEEAINKKDYDLIREFIKEKHEISPYVLNMAMVAKKDDIVEGLFDMGVEITKSTLYTAISNGYNSIALHCMDSAECGMSELKACILADNVYLLKMMIDKCPTKYIINRLINYAKLNKKDKCINYLTHN